MPCRQLFPHSRIYCTAKGAWQTRHQLRTLLSALLQGKPQLMTTGDVYPALLSSSPTLCWLTPSPSSMFLSQCVVTLCWVFQAFPLSQRGKYWTRWSDSARKAWFSLEFLCINQLLFLYVIKCLQEDRPMQCCELHNSYFFSGCLPNRFVFLSSLQYPSSALLSFNTKQRGSRKN